MFRVPHCTNKLRHQQHIVEGGDGEEWEYLSQISQQCCYSYQCWREH